MRNEKKQTGRVNYIWVLAGGYLLYLAFQIFKTLLSGESGSPLVGAAGGILFVGVGTFLLLREWKAYQYGQAHIDDPETWSDESEFLEAPEDSDREGDR